MCLLRDGNDTHLVGQPKRFNGVAFTSDEVCRQRRLVAILDSHIMGPLLSYVYRTATAKAAEILCEGSHTKAARQSVLSSWQQTSRDHLLAMVEV